MHGSLVSGFSFPVFANKGPVFKNIALLKLAITIGVLKIRSIINVMQNEVILTNENVHAVFVKVI